MPTRTKTHRVRLPRTGITLTTEEAQAASMAMVDMARDVLAMMRTMVETNLRLAKAVEWSQLDASTKVRP